MNEAQDVFEREMRANGMYDNGSTAMVRDPETGGYADSDTNAMWAGFLLAFGVTTELRHLLDELLSRGTVWPSAIEQDDYSMDFEEWARRVKLALAKAKCE